MMYTLEREQCVQCSLTDAWNFLKKPSNLNCITPADLDFQIISDLPEEMYNGLLIEYRIKIPVIGNHCWVAEIKHIHDYAFVDEQRIGPYSFWYHYHKLIDFDGRVKVIDRVYYDVPYGLIGRVLHALFIRKTLERIFDFRKEKLDEIMN